MAKKKYLVDLSDAEQQELQQLIRRGKHSSRRVTRAVTCHITCRHAFSLFHQNRPKMRPCRGLPYGMVVHIDLEPAKKRLRR
jgi:hypothetical protein